MWVWPLKNNEPLFPDLPGSFGAIRKEDIHTGVDLYCELGTEIVACESGKVVAIDWFTGKHVKNNKGEISDWWNDTKVVLVEGGSGVIAYGEVGPDTITLKVGDFVDAGDLIGVVNTSVLKTFKGRPMVMLHLELLTHGTLQNPWWDFPAGLKLEREGIFRDFNIPQPACLLDPSSYLEASARNILGKNMECVNRFELSSYNGSSFIDPTALRKPSKYWEVWGGAP